MVIPTNLKVISRQEKKSLMLLIKYKMYVCVCRALFRYSIAEAWSEYQTPARDTFYVLPPVDTSDFNRQFAFRSESQGERRAFAPESNPPLAIKLPQSSLPSHNIHFPVFGTSIVYFVGIVEKNKRHYCQVPPTYAINYLFLFRNKTWSLKRKNYPWDFCRMKYNQIENEATKRARLWRYWP